MNGILITFYNVFLVVCAVFGIHRMWLAFTAVRAPGSDPLPLRQWDVLPRVTIQLPVYNERYVIERLIHAVCEIDYPRDLLEIQVLDDSTDDTTERAKTAVNKYRGEGTNIVLIRRSHRTGFKAGALAEGLKTASGEFIAVFDADFLPRPDFLKKTVHHFTNSDIGMVQVRWGHQNPDESFLNRVQTVIIDGHFVVDQRARASSGRFFNFNGSAGVWRKNAIQDAGGWHSDTLAEDMDLSYRAQLSGWKFVLLSEYEVVQELPEDIAAFKQQQYRWSKGSLELAKKILKTVWRSEVPFAIKLEASFHLLGNIAYAFVALSALLSWPMMFATISKKTVDSDFFGAILFLICFGSTFFYFAVSQTRYRSHFIKRLFYFPPVFAVVAGLSLIHIKAMVEVLFNKRTPFIRTPKRGDKLGSSMPLFSPSGYKIPMDVVFLFEVFMAAYLLTVIIIGVDRGMFESLPFLVLMEAGFLYVLKKNLSEYFRVAGNAIKTFFGFTPSSKS